MSSVALTRSDLPVSRLRREAMGAEILFEDGSSATITGIEGQADKSAKGVVALLRLIWPLYVLETELEWRHPSLSEFKSRFSALVLKAEPENLMEVDEDTETVTFDREVFRERLDRAQSSREVFDSVPIARPDHALDLL